jgi:hypothetical protein
MRSLFILALTLAMAWVTWSASTIDENNPYAYGANLGWIHCRADGNNGAVIGEFVCSDYLYGANIGWIHLGNGAPTNGIHYFNTSANDYGVNHDGEGHLDGYAWGANVGWLVFETNYGKPTVDLLTGNLSGYIWGANVGWISLSNLEAYVKTETMSSGPDSDGDGIPDQWELKMVGSLTTLTANGDYDGDRVLDKDEYVSDTRPNDSNSHMDITAYAEIGGTNVQLSWSSEPTRLYKLEASSAITNDAPWTDCSLGLIPPYPPPATETSQGFTDCAVTQRFYRVQAVRPLSP